MHKTALAGGVMGGELTCAGGTPTINNTDSIELEGPAAVAPAVYFDLKKGPMAPGTTSESPELSEIEIDVEWPDGFFGLGGGTGDDRFMTTEGVPGKDRISGGGNRDVLYGEGGKDRVKGGDGRDIIEVKGGKRDRVKCGAGNDKVFADGKDKIAGGCEKVEVF